MTEFEAYPHIEVEEEAQSIFVLVQLKRPQTKTKGGIYLADESKDMDQYMVDRGIIKAIGPCAFKYRDTGENWPGHPSLKVGDEVRVPVYGGTSWYLHENEPDMKTKMALFKDNEILAKFKRKS